MPFFVYKARTVNANTVKGYIYAENKEGIYPLVKQQNMQLLYAFKVHEILLLFPSSIEKYDFCKNLFQSLSQLLKAQIPLLDAFKMIGEQTPKLCFKKIIYHIIFDLENGKTISEAMQMYASFFGPVALKNIMISEQSGDYTQAFDILYDYFDWALKHRSNLMQAIRYPLTLLCFVTFLMIGFDLYLLPELNSFLKMNQMESSSIHFWVQMKTAIKDVFWFFVFGICTLVYLIYRKKIPNRILKKSYYLPFGKIFFEKEWGIFLHVLGLLLESHVPIKTAFYLAMNDVRLSYLKSDLQIAGALIESGSTLTKAFSCISYADPITLRFIYLGEQSSKLNQNLYLCSKIIYSKFYQKMNRIVHLIQPLFILFIGLFLLFIIHIFVLPIYDVLLKLEGA